MIMIMKFWSRIGDSQPINHGAAENSMEALSWASDFNSIHRVNYVTL